MSNSQSAIPRAGFLALPVLLLSLGGVASAQTLLQRCLGIVPGREPAGKISPSPATMSYCWQLPGWSLYEQAGQRFAAGDHAGAARLLQQSAQAGNAIAQLRLEMMYVKGAACRWMRRPRCIG